MLTSAVGGSSSSEESRTEASVFVGIFCGFRVFARVFCVLSGVFVGVLTGVFAISRELQLLVMRVEIPGLSELPGPGIFGVAEGTRLSGRWTSVLRWKNLYRK